MILDQELKEPFQALLPPSKKIISIEKLFGHASYRVYYRVHTQDQQTFIVMKIPAGLQSVSEEITNYQGPKDELPFLNIARYLETNHIPVPQVLATDFERGHILLTDLGDITFEKQLAETPTDQWENLYRQSIDLLIQLQIAGEKKPDKKCMAFQRSFDARLFYWEFDHFLEYGIEDRFSLKISEQDQTRLQELAREMIEPILKIPFGLTHRDFQSRNLMSKSKKLYLIDFQDALFGPPQYDLVALLRDSYVELPWETVLSLINYYLENREKADLPKLDRKEFIKNFHRVTLQRKLKDSGRFQFIFKVKNNPNFLPSMPASLRYVKQAFQECSEYGELQQILARYVPELR